MYSLIPLFLFYYHRLFNLAAKLDISNEYIHILFLRQQKKIKT